MIKLEKAREYRVEIFFFLSLFFFFFLSRFSPLYPYYASLFFLSIPLFSFLFFLCFFFSFLSFSRFFVLFTISSSSFFLFSFFCPFFLSFPPSLFIGKTEGAKTPYYPCPRGTWAGRPLCSRPEQPKGYVPFLLRPHRDVVSRVFLRFRR